MTDLTDAELVTECLGGKMDCFAELVRRYQDPVYNLAYRMTSNASEAEDLAQEAFIRAFRKLRKYKPEYQFRNWVMTICANLTKNRFRSVVRKRNAEEAHLDLYSRHPDPMDPRRIALEEAITLLPRSLRVPLVLKHVEGMSYEEVSGVLGISLSAAKMRVKRARDELTALLGQTESAAKEKKS
ncbi:MAG: sigma-70 family RNA polymerase sigma factor [Verrucomicrobia bacterium]|nr:sigma-70 family RNA polymerase sigma factor [Verrucomicrobiota bacterium]